MLGSSWQMSLAWPRCQGPSRVLDARLSHHGWAQYCGVTMIPLMTWLLILSKHLGMSESGGKV